MDNNVVSEAINRFIQDCWIKVNNYYSAAVSDKNIYIFGSGVYGRFLYHALNHLGFGKQIKAFIINIPSDISSVFDIPVLDVSQIAFDNKKDIVVVGVQNSYRVVEYLRNASISFIEADYDCSFFQDNLMYSFYKCIEVSSVSDMVGKIRTYYDNVLGNEDDVLSLYEEDLSKSIIHNRLEFYKSGNTKYIDAIPVNYNQYFQNEYYKIHDKEVYVDCGAFDGDSVNSFCEFTYGKYEKIICIEPDKISFRKLEENTKQCHDVELFNCATGKEESEILFDSKGVLGSAASETGEIVRVKRLDDLLKDQKVTLIKMDIEGAELDTLIGAQTVIKNFKPKLAVCIYHKIDDIIVIPRYLKELVPEYKFKVRQHSKSMLETVLYAEV